MGAERRREQITEEVSYHQTGAAPSRTCTWRATAVRRDPSRYVEEGEHVRIRASCLASVSWSARNTCSMVPGPAFCTGSYPASVPGPLRLAEGWNVEAGAARGTHRVGSRAPSWRWWRDSGGGRGVGLLGEGERLRKGAGGEARRDRRWVGEKASASGDGGGLFWREARGKGKNYKNNDI
ncbi:unnamed protein product [Miscanthus lutarioriparius]|uniref:Uncharacterized protein n=1 Tax=Miscanthus lutarioriparius TaxID=422564 RepID=A0A811QMR1_9POAL|nr:unnamed protein product [Miscanthus lutarioriparius]